MEKEIPLKTRRDIQVNIFINGLKRVRRMIHVADVIVTSDRVEEVTEGVSDLLNDVCADLDELIKKAEPLLKSEEKKAA